MLYPALRSLLLHFAGATLMVAGAALAGHALAASGDDEPLAGDSRAHDPTLWIDPQGQWHVFATGPGVQRLRSKDGRAWTREAPVFSTTTRPAWWAEAVPAQ